MAILKIARMGHPILKEVAAPIEDPTAPEIAALVADNLKSVGVNARDEDHELEHREGSRRLRRSGQPLHLAYILQPLEW